MSDRIERAADALWNARLKLNPIGPLRDFLAPDDIVGAYAVQAVNMRRVLAGGQKRIGRKIGPTSTAVQKQLGVDQPDFGILYDHMLYRGQSVAVPKGVLMQPRIEGEIAFIVNADIEEQGLPEAELRRRAGSAVAAYEIVDSAIADWKITLADTVADNASCGALVIGQDSRPLDSFDARMAGMVMTADGKVISLGVGAASLGDPLKAFAWLADLAVSQNDPIRTGEIVLTGALGPMVSLERGKHYRLEIAGFDPLDVRAE